jgi:hypothetical protein
MYERTSETIARILARDAEERAGAGGCNPTIRSYCIGVPTGVIWSTNAKPGPLDGQPRHDWFAVFVRADGSEVRS